MPYEKTDAITLRSVDYSESSLVLTFYTRDFGLVTTLAKGALRKSSRLVGHVDLFAWTEIVFVSGRLRDRMNILTEAFALQTFPRVRTDLARTYAAARAAELVLNLTVENDPSPGLFEELLALLRRLDAGLDPAVASFAFEARLLVATGFMPEVTRCVACGRGTRRKTVSFSLRLGGVICEDCAAGEPDLVEGVPAGALGLLGRLARRELTRLDRVAVAPAAAQQVRAFLDRYESYILGKELRTAKRPS
jgi:DNA repair protein RecO (recombination protein O)